MNSRKMNWLVYVLAIGCFVVSFFYPTTPQKMTTWRGEAVEIWTPSPFTHLRLALEPIYQITELLTMERMPGARGDGFESEQVERVQRTFYSLPLSLGWFTIVGSILFIPLIRTRELRPRTRFILKILAWTTFVATPLLALDFYRHATTYEPYFHLGLGAYLIVFAYFFASIAVFIAANHKQKPNKSVQATRD